MPTTEAVDQPHAPQSPAEIAAGADVFHEALAERLGERLADNARYVASWNRWLLFDGIAWRPDETLRVLDEARATCRAAAHAAGEARDKLRIGSAATVAAIERLARAGARHAASAGQWDAEPWLLNTPDGTVNLRTNQIGPHRRGDYLTKVTAVSPGGDCPLFRAVLARVFAGDEALIGFVQRALGYALTGETREHALFFAYGTGGNGKGVLLNTIARILGDYAAVAPIDGFIAAQAPGHASELATLRGARFVLVPETAPGAPWNEQRIKALTGGDPIAIRHKRGGAALTCWPSFKLFMAGNHKPSIRSVDEAIRRRLHIIPFGVTIPAAEVDRDLPRKLEAEWPGILAWMIAGCRFWQRKGLAPPAAVEQATADHLADEDIFGGWLAEWVHDAPQNAAETAANLFASWETYAAWAKEPAGSRKAFALAMRARGFTPARIGDAGAKGYRAIRLRRHSTASVMTAAMSGQRIPVEGL